MSPSTISHGCVRTPTTTRTSPTAMHAAAGRQGRLGRSDTRLFYPAAALAFHAQERYPGGRARGRRRECWISSVPTARPWEVNRRGPRLAVHADSSSHDGNERLERA